MMSSIIAWLNQFTSHPYIWSGVIVILLLILAFGFSVYFLILDEHRHLGYTGFAVFMLVILIGGSKLWYANYQVAQAKYVTVQTRYYYRTHAQMMLDKHHLHQIDQQLSHAKGVTKTTLLKQKHQLKSRIKHLHKHIYHYAKNIVLHTNSLSEQKRWTKRGHIKQHGLWL